MTTNLKNHILERIDLRTYFSKFIGEAASGKTEILVSSPFREDKHPSFSLNLESGLWKDFGTGDSGDLFTFEMHRSKCDIKTALMNLADFVGLLIHRPESHNKTTTKECPIAKDDLIRWNDSLFSGTGQQAKSYLNHRGLSDETLKKHLIGFDIQKSAVTIPLAINGKYVLALKRFHFEGGAWKISAGKKIVSTFGKSVLYCADLIENAPSVIVCEGELDCLMLRQHGFNAVTGTGGAGTWKYDWNKFLRGKDVVLIYDADLAGREGAAKVARSLNEIARNIRIVKLFPDMNDNGPNQKDVTDFFCAGGTADQLQDIISRSEYFTPTTISQDHTAKTGGVTQTEIARAVMAEIDVFTFGNEFYIYRDGVWRRDHSRLIERAIKRHIGHTANRSKIESIRYLVALESHRDEREINSNRMLINFQNGMFDLTHLEFLPHDKTYYSTIQLSLRYYPTVTCPRWDQFLKEVFCDDTELAMRLQEVFGYCLIPSTDQQKMFWLVGEGANGKGVALQVLESLIDKSNRTSLDIKNLSSPFVRSSIYNKLISVQGDFPHKFFGNEYWLKLIIGGDTIDAQEKFGPQFEFTPFCRFIFAMNSLPETNDKSHGFFRRVVMIPFRRVFDEKEQDRHLIEKLRKELPGIFLWALGGLKRLTENGKFTASDSSDEMLDGYKFENNSVGSFVEDCCVLHPECKAKSIDLWEHYQLYCTEDGIEPLERRDFAIQIKRNYPVVVKTQRMGSDDTPQRTYIGIELKHV